MIEALIEGAARIEDAGFPNMARRSGSSGLFPDTPFVTYPADQPHEDTGAARPSRPGTAFWRPRSKVPE